MAKTKKVDDWVDVPFTNESDGIDDWEDVPLEDRQSDNVLSNAIQSFKTIPSALLQVAKDAGGYLKDTATGKISMEEQGERVLTAGRGALDLIQGVGSIPETAISGALGILQGPGAKPTQELASRFGADKAAMEAQDVKYPGARMAGEVVPSLIVGGPGIVGTVAGALVGSYGSQVANTGKATLKDTLTDAIVGAGMHGAVNTVGAARRVASKLPVVQRGVDAVSSIPGKAGKGLLKILTDTSPEMSDQILMTSREAIDSARTIPEIAQAANENVAKLKAKIIAGSEKAVNIIQKEGVVLQTSVALGAIDEVLEGFQAAGVFGAEQMRDIKMVEALKSRIVDAGETLNATQTKGLLRQLDVSLSEVRKRAGDFASAGDAALMKIRQTVDKELKAASPAYAEAMEQVAKNAETLKTANRVFGNEQSVNNAVANAARAKGNPFNKEALKDLDEALGVGLAEELRVSTLRDYINAESTNGSRKAMIGTSIGGGVGGTIGGFVAGTPGAIVGTSVGSGVGGFVGGALDKGGRKFAEKALRLTQSEKLGRFNKLLQKASKAGAEKFILVHTILMNDPEYRKLVEE